MKTLKECVRRFSEVPESQWLQEAGNWACQKMTVWKALRKRLCFSEKLGQLPPLTVYVVPV
jgi:ubiquitin C-terminal hydrolase